MATQQPAARSVRAPLIAFLLSFALLLALMDLRLGVYDEAILLVGARLVAEGAVPHRDFYANYGPAQFAVLAGLFKLFGPSFLAARVYDTLIRAAIVAVTYRMLQHRTHPPIALAGAAACAAWMLGSGTYLYPMFPTLLLALASTQLLLGGRDGEIRLKRLFLAGALTGLAALFRYDVGFFVLAAHAFALLLVGWREAGSTRGRMRAFVRRLLAYCAGTLCVFVPAAALLLAAGAGPGFVHDILVYSPEYYPRMRSLPFPGLAAIVAAPQEAAVYLPFAALVVAAAALLARAVQNGPDRLFVLLIGSLILFLSLKGLVRIQSVHLLLAIVPATILLAFLADRAGALPRPLQAAVGVAAALAVVAPLFGAVLRDSSASVAAPWPGAAPARLTPELACAAAYLRSHSRPDEAVFAGAMRHDKLLMNNVGLYFAAGRRPATHWHHFDPGLQTREDVQRQMIRELEERGTRWGVRDSSWDLAREPNESAVSSGVHLLDRYLAARYRPVQRFGPISLWLRKGEAPGAAAPLPATCR